MQNADILKIGRHLEFLNFNQKHKLNVSRKKSYLYHNLHDSYQLVLVTIISFNKFFIQLLKCVFYFVLLMARQVKNPYFD